MVSDHNVHEAQAPNFDMSSTPVVHNRYSKLQEHTDRLKVPLNSSEQGKIFYNSKRKPPSAQKSHKKAQGLDGENVAVSNF